MAHEISDSQLVRRFQRGDSSAFEKLVRRHQDRIVRLAAVWLDQSDRAEDVAQDVFLRSFTGLRRFRFGAEPATWLFRMTRNVCNEFNRTRRRHASVKTDPTATSVQSNVDSEVLRRETIAEIRALVALLPPRQRDVVLLRVFEELSVDDTARTLRCRPGTVKATLHKAMANLRRRYNEDAETNNE